MDRSGVERTVALTLFVFLFAAASYAQADLSVRFTGAPVNEFGGPILPLMPGRAAGYFATVTNAGPSSAQNVVLTIAFPPKTQISARPAVNTNGDATCSTQASATNLVVTCNQSTLVTGDQFVVSVAIVLDLDYPWQDGVAAIANVSSTTADPVAANNQAIVTLPVAAPITVPTLGDNARASLLLCLLAAGFFVVRPMVR
jgi:uncharacterized protein DUF11